MALPTNQQLVADGPTFRGEPFCQTATPTPFDFRTKMPVFRAESFVTNNKTRPISQGDTSAVVIASHFLVMH